MAVQTNIFKRDCQQLKMCTYIKSWKEPSCCKRVGGHRDKDKTHDNLHDIHTTDIKNIGTENIVFRFQEAVENLTFSSDMSDIIYSFLL